LLDGGQAFDSSAFVSHDSIIGKAPSHGFRIMPVLGGDIGRNGFGKIDRHMGFSWSVSE
jgi:hypothetical protein